MAQATKIPKNQLDTTLYFQGGTDVAIADGGTGVSTLPSGILKGAGLGAIAAATDGTDYISPSGSAILTTKSMDGGSNTFTNIPSSAIVTGAWQPWTPTFQNWTIGTGGSAGTVANYAQIGKVVHFYLISTLGSSGQSVGAGVTFTLPVAASAAILAGVPIGNVAVLCAGLRYQGALSFLSGNRISVTTLFVSGSNIQGLAISATSPGTWVAGNQIFVSGVYEAA